MGKDVQGERLEFVERVDRKFADGVPKGKELRLITTSHVMLTMSYWRMYGHQAICSPAYIQGR